MVDQVDLEVELEEMMALVDQVINLLLVLLKETMVVMVILLPKHRKVLAVVVEVELVQ